MLFAVQDFGLKAGQNVQRLFMEVRVKAGGEVGVHHDLGIGIVALEHHGVADHADVADKAAQFDAVRLFRQQGQDGGVRHVHAEGQLVDAHGFHFLQGLGGLTVVLPAVAALDAVDGGKMKALTGVQIVGEMGVPGEPDPALAVFPDPGGDGGVQLFGAGEAQGAVHKVLLIINDKQTVHSSDLLISIV